MTAIKNHDDVLNLIALGTMLKEKGYEGIDHLTHLNPVAAYIRISDCIAASLDHGSRVLDWGGGIGQISHLLEKRGLDVAYYCVGNDYPKEFCEAFPHLIKRAHKSDHEYNLPFEDASFDAVVSCGVLEHAPLLQQSLLELRRVLRPGGRFFVFHFPNKHSYTEWIAEKRGISGHPRKFSLAELKRVLLDHGFKPTKMWYSGFFPKTLIGAPEWMKSIYNKFFMGGIDKLFCRIFPFNRLANSIECIAIKMSDMH